MPTVRLGERQQAALSTLLALDPVSGGGAERSTLEALGRLIPSDVICLGIADCGTGYVLRTVSLPSRMASLHTGALTSIYPEGVLHELEDPRLRPLLERTGMRDGLLLCFRDGRDHVVSVWLDRRRRQFTDIDIALLRLVTPLLRRLLRQAATDLPAQLTTQERRVLHLVATGMSNADVAARLSIEPCTVRKHLEHTFRKLGVSNRLAAVRAYEAHSAVSATAADRETFA